MLQHAQIAVVVPAYNEERHIAATLRSMPAYVDHVVVVDDGSHDNTSARAQAVGDLRVTVLRHPENRGVGAALSTGYARAFAEGADVVAVMAGDNQMDPHDLHQLLAPVLSGDADYTKGDRLSHPQALRRMPFSRFMGNQVLSLGTRLVTGLPIRDSQCGYTALHRRAALALPMHELWRGYGYPNDLLGHLVAAKARVQDVTVRPIYADEKSGIRLRHALAVIPFVLARVLLRRALAAFSVRRVRQLCGLDAAARMWRAMVRI